MESKDFDYKKLNRILKEKNITAEQLAIMTGKTKKSVQPWLNGTTTPHKSSLKKLVDVLHISTESITKDGVIVARVDKKVILETLDLLLNVFLPFFSFYKKNNEEYQLNKFIKEENLRNALHNNSTRYRSIDDLYIKKVSLDKKLMNIVNGIKEYVAQDTFPLAEMKKVSTSILLELTDKAFRDKYEKIEHDELYSTVAKTSIKFIDDKIRQSHELQQMIYEDTIFTELSVLQLENQVISIRHEIESHLGIILNIFFSNIGIKNDLIFNVFPEYLYFTAYYLKAYEKSIADIDSVHYPYISDEFNKYLHWKVYPSGENEFVESILDSIDEKLMKWSDMDSNDKSFNKVLRGLLASLKVLSNPEVRLLVSKYIKNHRLDYSLELQALLEEIPIQWTQEERE